MDRNLISELGPQQRRCLELVGQGLSSKEAGRRLEMSPHTVDYHVKKALKTLNVTNRREAAQMLAVYEQRLGNSTADRRPRTRLSNVAEEFVQEMLANTIGDPIVALGRGAIVGLICGYALYLKVWVGPSFINLLHQIGY